MDVALSWAHLENNKEKVLLLALGRLDFLLQPLDLFLQLTLLILTVLLHVFFITAVPLLQKTRTSSDLRNTLGSSALSN